MGFTFDWNNFLNPTRLEFIFVFSLIAYLINHLYTTFVVPHFQGYFDPEQEKKIKMSKERQDQHHKELVELMSALAKSSKDPLTQFAEEANKDKSKVDGVDGIPHSANQTATEETTSDGETAQQKSEKKKKKKAKREAEQNVGKKNKTE